MRESMKAWTLWKKIPARDAAEIPPELKFPSNESDYESDYETEYECENDKVNLLMN